MSKHIIKIDNSEFIRQRNNLLKDYIEFCQKLDTKYLKLAASEFKEIILEEVSEFYKDYPDPIYYRRKRSLYKMFKIKIDINKCELRISFGGQFTDIEHAADNDYIYEITFKQGWHGGAIPKNQDALDYQGNPLIPDTPYWKTPFPELTQWGRPAEVMDEPILPNILTRLRNKDEALFREKQNEHNVYAKRMITKIQSLQRRIK